jgi:hypothetical protein
MPYAEFSTFVLEAHPPSPFSIAKEVLSYKPSEKDTRTVFPNGDSERKIYNHALLLENEEKALVEYRRRAKAEKWPKLPKDMEHLLIRYIAHGRFNVDAAQKAILLSMEWRKTFFAKPIRDTEVMEVLRTGCMYIGGRDSGMRPMIVLHIEKLPHTLPIDSVVRAFIFIQEYAIHYLYVPGIVETNVSVLDLGNIGFGTAYNLVGAVKSTLKTMQNHYVQRVYRAVCVNAPGWVSGLWSGIKPILSARQQAKTFILSSGDYSMLQEMFAPHQLQKRYGGSREEITTFYPFPLLPGPYDVKSTASDPKAVPNCHGVLGEQTRKGVVWESTGPRTPQRFAAGSWAVFREAGLPVPPAEQFEDGIGEDGTQVEIAQAPAPDPEPETSPEPAPLESNGAASNRQVSTKLVEAADSFPVSSDRPTEVQGEDVTVGICCTPFSYCNK